MNQRPVLTDVYQAVRGYRGPVLPGPPVPMAPVPGTDTAGTAGYRRGYYRRAGTAPVPAGTRGTGTRYRYGWYHSVPAGLGTDGRVPPLLVLNLATTKFSTTLLSTDDRLHAH